MTWDEWERSKRRVAEERATGLHLDHAPSAGGDGDLVVHQDDLGAVGHEAFQLHTRLHDQVDIAGAGADAHGAGTTMQAAAALKSHHFGMGAGLETTVSVWTSQVKAVLQAFAHISNHLDYSKKRHAHDDDAIAAEVRSRNGTAVPVSVLNSYFK
ncbi:MULTISPECIES: hypothetical protein [Streptomyces]|uniref:hypothetical protein n=1 Tax=Streptomyces TaxID=1883 RepID=UPI0013A970E3|nr:MULTISPECIES: hypothetical protein [Streptomyces]MBY8865523.1 hypothetical protein [Streptomyces sennicomposti]MYS42839.1 hypothetical protein [Streptomyces sp. SID5998]NED36741.1 hypothetical protein [Streptomyces sp. SID8499]